MAKLANFKGLVFLIWVFTVVTLKVDCQSTTETKSSANVSEEKNKESDINGSINLPNPSTTQTSSVPTGKARVPVERPSPFNLDDLTSSVSAGRFRVPVERPSPFALDDLNPSEPLSTLDLGFDFASNLNDALNSLNLNTNAGIGPIAPSTPKGRNRNNNNNNNIINNINQINPPTIETTSNLRAQFRPNLRTGKSNNIGNNNVISFGSLIGGNRQRMSLKMGFFSQLMSLIMPDPGLLMQRIRDVKDTYLERERERRLMARRSRNSGEDIMTSFLRKVLLKTVNKYQKGTGMMETMVHFRNERLKTFLNNPLVVSLLDTSEDTTTTLTNSQGLQSQQQDIGQEGSLWDFSNIILRQLG